jgi:hypothetical protein
MSVYEGAVVIEQSALLAKIRTGSGDEFWVRKTQLNQLPAPQKPKRLGFRDRRTGRVVRKAE